MVLATVTMVTVTLLVAMGLASYHGYCSSAMVLATFAMVTMVLVTVTMVTLPVLWC